MRPLVFILIGLFAALVVACTHSPGPSQKAYVQAIQQGNLPAIDFIKPSNSEGNSGCTAASMPSEILSYVNRLRSLGAMCGTTNYPPVTTLSWSIKLQQAATLHSLDMASHNFFNHKSATNGSTLPERLRAVGYTYQVAGENIGAGVSTVAQVMDMWIASPGHCRTLMTPDFVELGVSCQSSINSYYKTYWTLKAAAPK